VGREALLKHKTRKPADRFQEPDVLARYAPFFLRRCLPDRPCPPLPAGTSGGTLQMCELSRWYRRVCRLLRVSTPRPRTFVSV
jgi:hypothetical protein